MPATDDEIREKYLERAIRELNAFARRLGECEHCPRGQLMPVLGSGHPQADIFMVKYSARPSEVEEGVAFYGRTGNALMKSLKRLSIDPLAVYGTLCVKCPVADPGARRPGLRGAADRGAGDRRAQDDGRDGARRAGGDQRAGHPLARPLRAEPGELQQFTPAIEALYVPNIDDALDEEPPSVSSGGPSACWGNGGLTCRRTSQPNRGGRVADGGAAPVQHLADRAINRV